MPDLPMIADCMECHVPNAPWMSEAGRYLCLDKCQPRHRAQVARHAAICEERTRLNLEREAEQARLAKLVAANPETKRRVRAALKCDGHPTVTADMISISLFHGDIQHVTYEALTKLSVYFGTTSINLRHDPGEPDYSELTPGCPDSITIEVNRWSLPTLCDSDASYVSWYDIMKASQR